MSGEELYLYLVVLAIVVGTTLARSGEDGNPKLINFVSKVLIDAETRYNDFERIALALGMAAKKLSPHYSHAY